ncbi:MAG: toxin HicA [Gammaproteobacteria bacterium]|nr:toxin HicA [Gammaproteobacteria bacterium]
MDDIVKIIARMRENPKGVRFSELQKICRHYFGRPRRSKSSHCIYKTPWSGDPRVNIQNQKGYAKAYQVKQVLLAIERLEVNHGS